MPLNLADLASLEQTYLGVAAVGLPPHALVGDPWLRLDYLTAVSHALVEAKSADTYLMGEGPEPKPEFLTALKEAVWALEEKSIIGTSPPVVLFSFDAPKPGKPDLSTIDPNTPPAIFDRYLAHQCMNALLAQPEVYQFLMGKYAESSEQWQRLTEQGYGQGPHI